MECRLQLMQWQPLICAWQYNSFTPGLKLKAKERYLSEYSKSSAKIGIGIGIGLGGRLRLSPLTALPDTDSDTDRYEQQKQPQSLFELDGIILSSCLVGLLTGICVVLFNNGIHEIRDLFWDGIPNRGASWLREEPIEAIWTRVILVPACGGFIVSILNELRAALDNAQEQRASTNRSNINLNVFKAALQPLLKAAAACVTLGTGNSLGPEGPSVDIGKSVAKGVGTLFDRDKGSQRKLSLVAAGSAAGIASGFNAAVAGCFFAVESVLWPSPSTDSPTSLTNTTSMVILSAVIASVVSEVGLGSEPAFKVPEYDFRSPGELPLYLLLGVLCGLVSLVLSRCTTYMLVIVDNLHKLLGMPKAVFPVMGGLAIGLISLFYPEILYWGFENVDILLESRPFVQGLSASVLLQLVAVKVVATSLCRASGLVGGYYAPSLFIGAATGMAYGKFINFVIAQSNPTIHLSILEVASPQAYGLVGMAATLAGVCQVPLTSVLLLFELTQDYRIVLPLLGAVGLSSWITSGQMRRRDVKETKEAEQRNFHKTLQYKTYPSRTGGLLSSYFFAKEESYTSNLCEVESSLCMDDSDLTIEELEKTIFVSEAMRTRYVTVLATTSLVEAVTLMLAEKQSCAMIVDNDNMLIGLLTLGDIEDFCKYAKAESSEPKKLLVSEICFVDDEKCQVPWTATPNMDLLSALMIMKRHSLSQLPVVLEHIRDQRGYLVGLLDRESITLTYRALATKRSLV